MDELIFSPLTEIAQAIRERQVSSTEVVTAHLERIQAVNRHLNAVVAFAETALEEAARADDALDRGERLPPLHGVPFTIKDSFDTAGVVSTWGTPGRAHTIPERDATVVRRLREAGAILLGKTNTSEFTLSFETDNPVYGATYNPYDLSRSPGGSSGGAAAIVAAGGSPFEIGTDTGGSVRLPAHFCGIAGLRPTSGRVPRTGHAIPFGGLTDSFTTVGPLARSVNDLAYVLPLIAGPDVHDPFIVPMPLKDVGTVDVGSLRVAWFTDNGVVTPTRETTMMVEQAAKALADAGARLEESRPPDVDQTFELLRGMLNATGRAWEKILLDEVGTALDETSMAFVHNASPLSPDQFVHLHGRWDRFRSKMLQFMDSYDLILCPVNARQAIPAGMLEQYILSYTYTMTFNLTGWPAAVVRFGTAADGLPLGVQVVARPWREDIALAAAGYLEQASGGWQKPPL